MDKKLFKSILLIITYAVVLVVALARLDVVGGAVLWALGLVKPLIIGFAIAFVLNRPCHFFHRLYLRGLGEKNKTLCRGLAVVSSYVALLAVVAALFAFVLPKFVESIQTFVGNLSGYLTNIQTGYNQIIGSLHLEDAESIDLSGLDEKLSGAFDYILGFLSDLGPQLIQFTSGLVSAVVTGFLAVVFSIYMLAGQEKLMRSCRRVFRAYVPARIAGPVGDVVRLTGDTFTRFVTGQLIEACILGGLCACGMLFIQADYAPLIGVIVGTSALVPVAGAYVGAVISALLLLVVSPLKALIFLIFLLILQQFEGNVIYPKVVGTTIGLPGLWVLAAVTAGAGIGGLLGVLLSVPVASVLYTLLRRDVGRRLKDSGGEP